jgi:zinc transporter 6
MFVVVTMYPMSVYTGRILLQTTPTHILPQLERYLSEALAVDGVIEFKNEHFWTISFGKLVSF